MKISHFMVLSLLFAVSCGESDRSEIYNENNTNVINGVVYNINEKPINGLYRTYYQNGNLRMEVYSQNGLPNGLGKFYDEEGNLVYQGTFKDGQMDGTILQYYPDGTVHNEMNYKQGIIDGTQKVYDSKAEQTAEITYENGKPVSGYVLLNDVKIELSDDELAAFMPKSEQPADNETSAKE